MEIKKFISTDTKPLSSILYQAVHTISVDIYSNEQQKAWAPESILEQNLILNKTWICLIEEKIVGYVDFIPTKGYINHLYTHPNHQSKGVATLLYQTVETEAINQRIGKLTVDASKVALPFFLHKGFILEKENIVERKGIEMINFTLSKMII